MYLTLPYFTVSVADLLANEKHPGVWLLFCLPPPGGERGVQVFTAILTSAPSSGIVLTEIFKGQATTPFKSSLFIFKFNFS